MSPQDRMTPHGRHVPSGQNDLSEYADPSGRSRSLTKGSGVAQRPLAHGRGAAARASRWGTGGACAGRGERRARVGVPERGARGPPSLPPAPPAATAPAPPPPRRWRARAGGSSAPSRGAASATSSIRGDTSSFTV